MFDFNLVGENDLPSVQTVDLKNNRAFIKKDGPYGFWTISLERGQLPECLKGSYTSDHLAKKDLVKYMKSKGRIND